VLRLTSWINGVVYSEAGSPDGVLLNRGVASLVGVDVNVADVEGGAVAAEVGAGDGAESGIWPIHRRDNETNAKPTSSQVEASVRVFIQCESRVKPSGDRYYGCRMAQVSSPEAPVNKMISSI